MHAGSAGPPPVRRAPTGGQPYRVPTPRRLGRLALIILFLVAVNLAVICYHGDPRQKWQHARALTAAARPARPAPGQGGPVLAPPPPSSSPAGIPRAPASLAPAPARPAPLQLVLAPGQGLAEALGTLGVEAGEALAAARSLGGHVDLRRLMPGDTLRIERDGRGQLAALALWRDGSRLATSRRQGSGWQGGGAPGAQRQVRATAVVGTIERSLVASLFALKESAPLAQAVADIFAAQVNLITDVRADDAFALLVDKHFEDGQFCGYGPVRVAQLTLGGRRLRAFFFADDAGDDDPQAAAGPTAGSHFDVDGYALAQPLLRLPLAAASIGSGFGQRLHPVLGLSRHHNGIDYPMPEGTAVWSVGDGLVVRAGWHGDFGRLVEVKHADGWLSQYAHLSQVYVHLGQRVQQRQTIGAVGQTGLATGPHLHYGLKRWGTFVDAAAPCQQAGARVPVEEHRRFAATVALGLAWLERSAGGQQLARLSQR